MSTYYVLGTEYINKQNRQRNSGGRDGERQIINNNLLLEDSKCMDRRKDEHASRNLRAFEGGAGKVVG